MTVKLSDIVLLRVAEYTLKKADWSRYIDKCDINAMHQNKCIAFVSHLSISTGTGTGTDVSRKGSIMAKPSQ